MNRINWMIVTGTMALSACTVQNQPESVAAQPVTVDVATETAPVEPAPAEAAAIQEPVPVATVEAPIVEPPPAQVVFQEPPPLVSIEPDVYVVQNYSVPVYYVDDRYWYHRGGSWYYTTYWDEPWVQVNINVVPSRISHRDHHHYVHYRGYGDSHVWREPRAHRHAASVAERQRDILHREAERRREAREYERHHHVDRDRERRADRDRDRHREEQRARERRDDRRREEQRARVIDQPRAPRVDVDRKRVEPTRKQRVEVPRLSPRRDVTPPRVEPPRQQPRVAPTKKVTPRVHLDADRQRVRPPQTQPRVAPKVDRSHAPKVTPQPVKKPGVIHPQPPRGRSDKRPST
ncbi:MAG: hypothetical protein HOW73_07945 [Polyangiaceae bacterium]|nr:hypothetical protein [Polyangiaceae bacterium]